MYNPSLQEYKDTFQCSNSWREIAQTVGKDETICQQGLIYLHGIFVKVRGKTKGRSGNAGDNVIRALTKLG